MLLFFSRLLDELVPVVLLPYTIRHVCGYGSQFLSPLNVEHLVVKEDVWFDFLQHWAFRRPGHEQSLVNL